MMDRMKMLLLFVPCAITALAADISGKWKGSAEGPNGPIERTFTFKVDGTKLTGETESQMMGKSTIEDGKIEGDNLTFTVNANFQGNEMKLAYKGHVTGNEIKLTVDFGGNAVEYTLKKI